MSAPETLTPEREEEVRALRMRWRILQEKLAEYRDAATQYKRIEHQVLGHYPACARPGPFIVDGTIIECHDKDDSDREWRFSYTDAVVIP